MLPLRNAWMLMSFAVVSAISISPTEEQALVKGLLQTYDGTIRPSGSNRTGEGSSPTIVSVNLYVRWINLDDVKMTLETQLTFRMQWIDERLKFKKDGIQYLTLPRHFGREKLWKPDLFFSNEREYRTHDGLTPNEYYRVFPDGEILYSTRISLKLSCPMMLNKYPLHPQMCSIRMASYGYTTDDIIFVWKSVDPVQIVHIPLENFSLRNFTTDYCDSLTNTGTYSCIRVDLWFIREASDWIREVYAPMIVTLVFIWLSMWISPLDNAVVRTLFLGTGVFYCKWLSKTSPVVSWNTSCDICLLAAVLQFVIVIRLSLRKQENTNINRWSNGIDIVMRIIYPIAILILVVIYYVTYAMSDDDDNKL